MFRSLYQTVTLKAPRRPARRAYDEPRQTAARIWEAARIAEKVNDNYCIPTSEGFEVCHNHKVHTFTGAEAQRVRDLAALMAVDPCDWILYIYSINA